MDFEIRLFIIRDELEHKGKLERTSESSLVGGEATTIDDKKLWDFLESTICWSWHFVNVKMSDFGRHPGYFSFTVKRVLFLSSLDKFRNSRGLSLAPAPPTGRRRKCWQQSCRRAFPRAFCWVCFGGPCLKQRRSARKGSSKKTLRIAERGQRAAFLLDIPR